MYQIRNLTQIYIRNHKEVRAIDNISFDLPDKGLIFLYGAKLSGKSTLLHLLAGTAKPTSGDIICNRKSFSYFKDEEYERFRSSVGIYYHDNNLIDNLTVRDNIALVLDLYYRDREPDSIIRSLDIPSLDSMLNKYPRNLSVRELQWISYAIAIVKNPKIILLDDPTANMDSATSKSMFDRLKVLSQDKLIIVATSDKSLADKYADRIIEIDSGKIIRDTASGYRYEGDSVIDLVNKVNLSTRLSYKFLGLSVRRTLLRLIILSILIISIMSISAVIYSFKNIDYDYAISRNLTDKDIPYVYLIPNDYPVGTYTISSHSINVIENSYSNDKLLKVYYPDHNYTKVIVGDISLLGFTLYDNALPLDEDGVYITDVYADILLNEGDNYIYINNKKTYLTNDYDIFDLIERTIYLYNDQGFTIYGIINSNEYELYRNINNEGNMTKYHLEYNIHNIHIALYSSYDYVAKNKNYRLLFNEKYNLNAEITQYNLKCNMPFNLISAGDNNWYNYVTDKGMSYNNPNSSLKKGEVMLSIEQYNYLFNTNIRASDLHKNHRPRDLPERIGSNINLVIRDINNNIIYSSTFIIKGIILDNYIDYYQYRNVYILNSAEDYNDILSIIRPYQSGYIVNVPRDKDEIQEFLQLIERAELIPIDSYNAELYYLKYYSNNIEITNDLSMSFNSLLNTLFIILCIIVLFLIRRCIKPAIRKNKRASQIMRLYGASVNDIRLIYIRMVAYLSLVLIILTSLAFSLLYLYINNQIYVYEPKLIDYFTLIIVMTMLTLLAAIRPILSIRKYKLVNLLR